VRVCPADSSSSFVHHYVYDMRVDPDVRELADSQFRFVPGHSGGDRVSLQSVDSPDRYVRATSTGVRIDPVEATGTCAAEASFQRLPGLANPRGMSLQSVASPGAYLRHDKSRLVLGQASGSKTTFLLT
jgi:hypothetical protein